MRDRERYVVLYVSITPIDGIRNYTGRAGRVIREGDVEIGIRLCGIILAIAEGKENVHIRYIYIRNLLYGDGLLNGMCASIHVRNYQGYSEVFRCTT